MINLLLFFSLFAFAIFILGIYHAVVRHNPFGQPFLLFWMGIFVWGDALFIGLFWFLDSLVCYLLNDWHLFLISISVFWLVRSFGETIYWLNQQFSPLERNPPFTLFGFKLFNNDSIWFIYQVVWQCLLVISILTTIYLVSK